MTWHPGSEHPHVTEGVCRCEVVYEEVLIDGRKAYRLLGGNYSPQCGLSAHRVKARNV